MERSDIGIRFSKRSSAVRARETAKAMVWGYYQNGREYFPFDDMKKENADGWLHYPGRYVGCEKMSAFTALYGEYRMNYRRSSGRGTGDMSNREEAEEMIRHISTIGDCFVFEDCADVGDNHQIEHFYFEDFFSMLCFLLASTCPDEKFEGMERHTGTGYSKRILTHAVYDGETLRFEQLEGDPVYNTLIVSWARNGDDFVKRSLAFPSIRVDIRTDEHEAIRQDEQLAGWITSVNDIRMIKGEKIDRKTNPEALLDAVYDRGVNGEVDMVSAELCFKHPSFNPYPYVMLNAASRDVCERLRDELSSMLTVKGYKTKSFSILNANELCNR